MGTEEFCGRAHSQFLAHVAPPIDRGVIRGIQAIMYYVYHGLYEKKWGSATERGLYRSRIVLREGRRRPAQRRGLRPGIPARLLRGGRQGIASDHPQLDEQIAAVGQHDVDQDRKSTRLNSSHT